MYLNRDQSKGLANFFLDLAKGLVLGGLGLTLTVPIEARVPAVFIFMPIAAWFVKIALDILEDTK